MNKVIYAVVALVLATGWMTPPAQASEPELIGTFDQWKAYVFEENGHKVCYMAADKPSKAEGKYAKRGDPVALITNRPAEGTKNVFTYMAGYSYKTDSDVEISVDGKIFKLFTQNDMAWAADAAADNAITQALRKGSKMVVKGTSSRGTQTKDTFSLKGSSKAHDAISQACNP